MTRKRRAVRPRAIAGILACGVAGAPVPSETESGDLSFILPSAGGVLLAAIDGEGHGPEAARAARIAAATLEAHAEDSLISLMLRCHDALQATRGAVMTIAYVDRRDRTLTWVGVGNVEGVIVRRDAWHDATARRVPSRSGLVGFQLPPLQASVLALQPRDTVVMATDGVDAAFADRVSLEGDAQAIADTLLATYRKGTDDALVVVAQYLGEARP